MAFRLKDCLCVTDGTSEYNFGRPTKRITIEILSSVIHPRSWSVKVDELPQLKGSEDWLSEDIKRRLQSDLDELESELRVHLPKEIKRALEFGDLRENSEYRAALDRQNVVKARIVELRQRISEISSIDLTRIPVGKAAYG